MPESPTSPAAVRPRVRTSRLLTWLRFQWWRLPVHALLIVLGLANLYPFFWMIGTSLKSEEESSKHRQTPLPMVKYRLGDTAGRYVIPDRGKLRAAKVEMENLLREDKPEQASQRARALLSEAGVAGADDLNPRQLVMVWSLWDENARRAESRLTYAPDSWYLQAYAEKFRLDRSAEKLQAAQAEIDQLVARGVLDPFYAQPDNFWSVLRNENFILFFLTSLAITASVVFLTIMLTSMTGYALARMRFPGKMLVLGLMIAGAVAPREAVIIPIFRLFKSLGALDGLWGMVVWMTGAGIGNTFLMAGFFMTLPKEVEEAAAVDGAGPFRTFFDVALPMARPIVMTVGLFAFLTAWNDFLVPLLCTVSNPSMQPLAVAVYNFQRGHPGKWHEINAAASVMIVPVILLFVLLQKHVVKGVAVGAVKG